MNAEEAFQILRSTLADADKSLLDCEFPVKLRDYLYEQMDASPSLRLNYLASRLNDQNWNELKQLVEIFYSPLMKALT